MLIKYELIMSVTSMRLLSTMSVTSMGGHGWWVQISALILQHFLSVRVSQKRLCAG